jgi:hypothetical protein
VSLATNKQWPASFVPLLLSFFFFQLVGSWKVEEKKKVMDGFVLL